VAMVTRVRSGSGVNAARREVQGRLSAPKDLPKEFSPYLLGADTVGLGQGAVMSQARTYFEQVPLEVVKKVAVLDAPARPSKRARTAKKRKVKGKR
jgi:hypothetical protein